MFNLLIVLALAVNIYINQQHNACIPINFSYVVWCKMKLNELEYNASDLRFNIKLYGVDSRSIQNIIPMTNVYNVISFPSSLLHLWLMLLGS